MPLSVGLLEPLRQAQGPSHASSAGATTTPLRVVRHRLLDDEGPCSIKHASEVIELAPLEVRMDLVPHLQDLQNESGAVQGSPGHDQSDALPSRHPTGIRARINHGAVEFRVLGRSTPVVFAELEAACAAQLPHITLVQTSPERRARWLDFAFRKWRNEDSCLYVVGIEHTQAGTAPPRAPWPSFPGSLP